MGHQGGRIYKWESFQKGLVWLSQTLPRSLHALPAWLLSLGKTWQTLQPPVLRFFQEMGNTTIPSAC